MSTYGTVRQTEQLTPALVRVVFDGDGLAEFAPTEWTDQYVNARFLPDGSAFAPPFDLEQAMSLPREERPVGRRITIRAWDPAAGTVTMDFVVHGEAGHAGRWARHARPGDRLQFTGPSGGYRPDPAADTYLFAGDESALPAIGASLEQVPARAPAFAVLVVDDAAGEVDLGGSADLHPTWLHRADARPGDP
ncbi:MAG TPA: siderophore-interacting protein, partial [Acidimicrobiales bacterium]|nr:siderophore-interacting protein [Acidimicrobiales bacterium]